MLRPHVPALAFPPSDTGSFEGFSQQQTLTCLTLPLVFSGYGKLFSVNCVWSRQRIEEELIRWRLDMG